MNLLFKREQTSSRLFKVTFKTWAKVDLDEEEEALSKRYNLADALLIQDFQPKLVRNAVLIGALAWALSYLVLSVILPDGFAGFLTFFAGIAAAYFFYHRFRETIFVKDLIHGRTFSCISIVDLARKEAWLEDRVSVLRQVLESAKNWDGTETVPITALPRDEAKVVMLRAA